MKTLKILILIRIIYLIVAAVVCAYYFQTVSTSILYCSISHQSISSLKRQDPIQISGCPFIDIKLYLSSIIDMVLVLIKLKFVVPKFCCIKFFSTIFCSPDNTLPSIMTKVLLIFSLGISTTKRRPQSWLKFLNHLKTIILQLQFVLENLCKIL